MCQCIRCSAKLIKKKTLISKPITLKPNDGETLGDFSYTTQSLKLRYDLRNLDIPKNVEITGMQLKFYAETDMHSSKLALDPVRSKMLLNSIYPRDNGDRYCSRYTTLEKRSKTI